MTPSGAIASKAPSWSDAQGAIERVGVPCSPADRDLIEGPQHPPEEGLLEELGRHQEPGLAAGPAAQLDRERRTVERAQMIEGHDRRTAGGHVLYAEHPNAEQQVHDR